MGNKYELSSHLIDQLQILLNKEAGLHSFTSTNVNTHSHSSLSSLFKEAIAGSNPCVDVSRCKHCSGDLLRGSQSIICVYCGHVQHHDSIPNPISFNSTFAFQWFLQSLRLDANESVGIPVGGTGTQFGDRGRGSIKNDEIPLSDFLDFKLKWGENARGFGVSDEEQVPGKRYLGLIGVDIEELLSQESRDYGSSSGNGQKTENEDLGVSGERNLSLFENTEPSEAALRSSEGGNDASFADWGAEFQSAIPDRGLENSVNISSSGDPSQSNLNLSSNTESSRQPFDFEQSNVNILVEGGGKALESVDSSFDRLPADELHATKTVSSYDGMRIDDSFDEWGDFRMSATSKITQGEPISTADPAIDSRDGLGIQDAYNDLSGSIVSKDIQVQKDICTVPDDAWNDLMLPSSGGDIPLQTNIDKLELLVGTGDLALGKEKSSPLLDGTSLDHQGVHVDNMQNKISDQSDSLGLWDNDIHLDIIGDQIPRKYSNSPVGEATTNLDNSFDMWNGFKGSENQATNTEVADSKISTERDSTFDAWNDFSGVGIEKKEEQAGDVDIVGGKGNDNKSESSALWNDNSLDEWSDFTGSTGVSNSKPDANDDASGAWNDFSSLVVAHANPQSSNTKKNEDQAVLEDDNQFSSLTDFHSLGLQTGNSSIGPYYNYTSSYQIDSQKSPNSLGNVENNSTIDSWGDFGVATSILEQQTRQASEAGASDDFFFGVSNSGKHSTSHADSQLNMFDGKSMGENATDSFGAWGDFTISNKALSDLNSTVNVPTSDDNEAVNHGDLLDAWNGIFSSPNVRAHNDTASGTVKTLDSNLFIPNMNFQYVGTSSSMHTDLDVGMIINQNGSTPVASAQSEVSDLVRVDAKADGYIDIEGKKLGESSSKEGKDLKAESLMSEMHDLSFMLKSSLSIPNSDSDT